MHKSYIICAIVYEASCRTRYHRQTDSYDHYGAGIMHWSLNVLLLFHTLLKTTKTFTVAIFIVELSKHCLYCFFFEGAGPARLASNISSKASLMIGFFILAEVSRLEVARFSQVGPYAIHKSAIHSMDTCCPSPAAFLSITRYQYSCMGLRL